MVFLKGRALLATVTTITATGFLLVGFDNGLMGGLGTFHDANWYTTYRVYSTDG